MNNESIVLSNATKSYVVGDVRTYALNEVSLSIGSSEFLAIMGPSGSGKTSLLNVIGLLDSIESGDYQIEGKSVAKLSRRSMRLQRRESFAFIFQSFNLLEHLTVWENIELPLRYKSVPKDERHTRVDEAITSLNIGHRAKHYPHALSGGQQQRVAIARATVSRPKVILADEPTGNLDSTNGQRVLKLLKEINGDGTAIVMVTHSAEAAGFAERVTTMKDGRITDS